MSRKTHRSKSYRRRHSRRRTVSRKRGGSCPCNTKFRGGRGGLGGVGIASRNTGTTGASAALYQWTGKTPGLSSGGKRRDR